MRGMCTSHCFVVLFKWDRIVLTETNLVFLALHNYTVEWNIEVLIVLHPSTEHRHAFGVSKLVKFWWLTWWYCHAIFLFYVAKNVFLWSLVRGVVFCLVCVWSVCVFLSRGGGGGGGGNNCCRFLLLFVFRFTVWLFGLFELCTASLNCLLKL